MIAKRPDTVIKSTCGATLIEAREGSFKTKEKRILSVQRKLIELLIQNVESAKRKWHLLNQTVYPIGPHDTHRCVGLFDHFGFKFIWVIMTAKFKTMTFIEEAKFDRLGQRQIKDYNPALQFFKKLWTKFLKAFRTQSCLMRVNLKFLLNFNKQFCFTH